jgi:hypothetical protein
MERLMDLAGDKTVLALRRACDRHVGGIEPREGVPQVLVDEIISNLPHGVLQAVLNPAIGADDGGIGVAIRIDESFYFYIASVAQYWIRLGHNGNSKLDCLNTCTD